MFEDQEPRQRECVRDRRLKSPKSDPNRPQPKEMDKLLLLVVCLLNFGQIGSEEARISNDVVLDYELIDEIFTTEVKDEWQAKNNNSDKLFPVEDKRKEHKNGNGNSNEMSSSGEEGKANDSSDIVMEPEKETSTANCSNGDPIVISALVILCSFHQALRK